MKHRNSDKALGRAGWRLAVPAVLAAGLILWMAADAFAICERAKGRDRDKDGLSNCIEWLVTGTNPRDADTDHDGLSDGLEIRHGTDPLTPDMDDDGLADGDEALGGTSLTSADTDGDGVSDLYDDSPNDPSIGGSNPGDGSNDPHPGDVTDPRPGDGSNDPHPGDVTDPHPGDGSDDPHSGDVTDPRPGDGSNDPHPGDENGGSGVCTKAEREVYLSNVAAPAGSRGKAKLEDEHCQTKFEVEVEGLPVGSYDLLVDGTFRGSFSVYRHERSSEGKIEFRSSPRGGSDLLLDFDPRGATIEVQQGGATLLSRIFPL